MSTENKKCKCRASKSHSDCAFCGHGYGDGIRVCGACKEDGIEGEVMCTTVDRMASCANCGSQMPSDPSLPFFRNRGPGSQIGKETCSICRHYESAHTGENTRNVVTEGLCTGFVPIGSYETDEYYCGCCGWG